MNEYISREDVLKKAKSSILVPADNEWDCGYNTAMAEMQEFIKQLPASDVPPVKYAKWILFAKDKIGRAFYCSNCRKATTTEDFENTPLEREEYFCPRCGADMRNE